MLRHGMARGREAGVVLIVALIALVAMTLAAIALVRSIDTGLVIAGNIAFKQSTTNATDVSVDAAVNWIDSVGGTEGFLDNDVPSNGYYASFKVTQDPNDPNKVYPCDMTGNKTSDVADDVDWDGSKSGNASCNMKAVAVSVMPTGYSASYVINRMFKFPGKREDADCYTPMLETNVKGSHGVGDYINRPVDQSGAGGAAVSGNQVYYAITTRVVGPRNTTSYVETIIYK
jgi:hypothetical protein